MQVARRDRYATSTLVIHNVNPSKSILITSVRYYDHSGTQLKDYIDGPLSLGPFASASFVVDIGDDRGGVGANFIVEWQANETVVSPIAEAIMSGGMGTQSIQGQTTKHSESGAQPLVKSRNESSGRNSVLERLGNAMKPNLR
jgi:hypothetical protein